MQWGNCVVIVGQYTCVSFPVPPAPSRDVIRDYAGAIRQEMHILEAEDAQIEPAADASFVNLRSLSGQLEKVPISSDAFWLAR